MLHGNGPSTRAIAVKHVGVYQFVSAVVQSGHDNHLAQISDHGDARRPGGDLQR
jgi:hypothetical protein